MLAKRGIATSVVVGVSLLLAAGTSGCAHSASLEEMTMTVSTTMPAPTTRPVVYIASPYTRGDPAMNTNFQCKIWDRLMTDGKVWPVAPLWSHFQHTVRPRKYEDWVAYDIALISRYDACLRLNAELPELGYSESKSSGADNEVKEFQRLGKPVFYSVEELYRWVDSARK